MTKTDKGRSLAQIVSARLRDDVRAGAPLRLPPIRDLARRYGVSLVTMFKAVRLLAETGVVATVRGHGIRVIGRGAPDLQEGAKSAAQERLFHTPKTAAHALCERLAERVNDGTYRAGRQLPKIAGIVAEDHVSDKTVRAAYRLLEKSGLAHRRGRRWYAGPRSTESIRISSLPPVILLFLAHERDHSWTYMFKNERTNRFAFAFSHEADTYGVEMQPVFPRTLGPQLEYTCGRERIRREIARLGTRYLGTFVPSGPERVADLVEWATWLVRLGRPVVWFDAHDDQGTARMMPTFARTYSRCHFDERAAVRTALDALAGLGHTRIGMPNSKASYHSWVLKRGAMFRELASQYNPPPEIMVQPSVEYPWEKGTTYEAVLERWRRQGLPHVRKAMAELDGERHGTLHGPLVYNTCILTPFVRDMGCTAIVAPNDLVAREFYSWFLSAGLSIPRDISLVSFDNQPSLHPFPIASVDFGFGSLGYRAVHIFLNDIAVKRDRRGNVPARPRLHARRTLGRARSRRIVADLRGDCC